MSTPTVPRYAPSDSGSASPNAASPNAASSDAASPNAASSDAASPNAASSDAAPSDTAASRERPTRRAILRDLVLFQMKLWLDGLKDIVLSPLSLAGAAFDVLFGSGLFYRVMGLGEKFDRWLNLYSAAERGRTKRGGMLDASIRDDEPSIDDLLRRSPDPDPPRDASARRRARE